MNLLIYEGLSRAGAKVTGKFLGEREDLLKQLQREGVTVTVLREEARRLRAGRFGTADFRAGIEQLSYLVAAGLRLDQAVAMLLKGARKTAVHRFWEAALAELKGGAQLSAALAGAAKTVEYPLTDFYLNLVAVGEETGELERALGNLRDHLEFQDGLNRQVRSALAYPAFLLAVSLAAVTFVVGFILPRFAQLYSARELARLPLVSRLTLGTGAFVHAHGAEFMLGGLAAAAALILAAATPVARRAGLNLLFTLPYLRPTLLQLELANLFSALGSMLAGGVEISRALRLARRVVGPGGLGRVLDETSAELREGRKISEVWSRHELIPEEVVALVAVGESGARLREIFERCAHKHLERFKARVELLLTFLEPGIIVVLGGFVGFIVVSILLAVVSLGDLYA